jgi:L-fucose isomerase-like protein
MGTIVEKTTVTVRLGFVPTYRFRWTAWTERMRDQSLAAFARMPSLEIVAPRPASHDTGSDAETGRVPHGAVSNLDQAEAIADYFSRQRVDGLVICPLDFGDERSASKIAERLHVPVLLYATKEPPARDDASLERLSDSYCGTLSVAAGLHRRRIPFHYAGLFFPHEPGFAAEIDTFARAVAVVAGLTNARIGQVGLRPPTFETVAYDEIAMARKFGQSVIFADLADIVDEAQRQADDGPWVREVVENLQQNVTEVTVARDYLVKAAKLELALAEFWRRSRLSALAAQCWPTVSRLTGISVCAVFGRLTERRMLTACEADVLGAVSMLASYRAALGETLPHFVDWTIQHREDPHRLLAWHCGNAPTCLARDPREVALRSRADMAGTLPVREGDPLAGLFQFQLRPGRVTFCRLAEYDGAWKMLIAAGEIMPSEEKLAGTWAWVVVRDQPRLYRTLVEEGFIHHASMVHGDQTRALIEACKFLDIEPVVVE